MIGALRQRVTLQSLSLTPDTGGGGSAGWTDVATVFAEITPLAGTERSQAERLVSNVSHRVMLRTGISVSAGQRLVWKGVALNIRAVLNLAARDRLLVCLCEEGVAT